MWISSNVTNIYLVSIRFGTLQHLCNTLYKSHHIPTVLGILPYNVFFLPVSKPHDYTKDPGVMWTEAAPPLSEEVSYVQPYHTPSTACDNEGREGNLYYWLMVRPFH
jgi:hypothetical protein